MMKFKIAFGCLAILAATAGGAAAAETEVRMVLAHANLAVGEEVFMYAVPKRLGYFSEEGLKVEVAGAAGGVQAGQLLVSGRAEFATILAEGVLMVREQGGTPVAFYSLKKNNGYTLAVMPGSSIAKLDDAAGKRVGFAVAGTGADQMLREQLRLDGVDPQYSAMSIGAGPAVATAIRGGQVDALLMWEAIYGLMEDQGLTLKHYEVPIQDKLAGYTLSTTEKYMTEHPETVSRFCRAVAKGLHFALTNPTAAVKIFYEEFPSTKPAGKDDTTAISEGVVVLKSWLDRAQKGVPYGQKTGAEEPVRWTYTNELYHKFGTLKSDLPAERAYTTKFFEACNDFDREAVARQAKAAN